MWFSQVTDGVWFGVAPGRLFHPIQGGIARKLCSARCVVSWVAAPEREELSAMGAAFCAGIAAGIYSKEVLQKVQRRPFLPQMEGGLLEKKRAGWRQAVAVLLGWPRTE